MKIKELTNLPHLWRMPKLARLLLFVLSVLVLVACAGPDAAPPEPQGEEVVSTVATEQDDTELPTPAVVEEVIPEDEAEPTAEVDVDVDVENSGQHTHDDETEHTHDGETEHAHSTSANSLDSGYLGSYNISDTGFGTEVIVTVDDVAQTRTIESNGLPNHQTGEFPNEGNPNVISAQDRSWTFTTNPVYTGIANIARTPGVAINGVKFEPGTAERANCESGEVHAIEAIQDITNLGLDFNNAHVQPTGEYHYHGISTELVDVFNTEQDLVHIGFAADGHLMYYSKSGAYQASYRIGTDQRAGTNCTYTQGGRNGQTITFGSTKDGSLASDWDYDESYGDLDACNGITVNGEYIYLVTHDYPYISRCLMGEFESGGPGGGAPPPGGGGGGQGGGPGGNGGGPGRGGAGQGGQGAGGQGGQGGGAP